MLAHVCGFASGFGDGLASGVEGRAVGVDTVRVNLDSSVAHTTQAVEAEPCAVQAASDVALQGEHRQTVGDEEHRSRVFVVAGMHGSACDALLEHLAGEFDEAVEEVSSGIRIIGEEATQVGKPGFVGVEVGVPLAHGGAHIAFAHARFAVGDFVDDEVVARCLEVSHAAEVVDDEAGTDSGLGRDGTGTRRGETVAADKANRGIANTGFGGGVIRT